MKQFLRLAAAAVALPWLGVAASCVSGSLASYVALGAGGCTIGGDTLNNFKILTGISGGSAIAPSSILLTPSGGTFNALLTISTTQSATSPTALEGIFTYDISGSQFIGISAALSGASETGSGGVTGIVNFCEGGNFGPDGVTGCAGLSGLLLTLDGTQNSDSSTFGKAVLVNVTDDFTIDPGPNGTAKGGTLTNSFTSVPEPVSLTLAGFGLMLAGAIKVRSLRAK